MSVSVEELLDKIDEMVDKAWSMPLSGGKCLVEADQLREILEDIRGNLPGELRQARAIVADRGDIIAKAKEEAEAHIRKAEEKAVQLVSQEEIVKQAQEKANEILNQAHQRARDMRKGAYDFSEDALHQTEDCLAAQLAEVRKARQMLRQPTGKASASSSIDIQE